MKFDILKIYFRRYVDKIQISLKSDKNNGYLTCEPMYIYDNISLNSSQREKFQKKIVKKSQNTYVMFNAFFFLKKSRRL